jgi:hypothetical protein
MDKLPDSRNSRLTRKFVKRKAKWYGLAAAFVGGGALLLKEGETH